MVTVDGCPPNRCNKRHLSICIVLWRRVLVCIAGIVGQRSMRILSSVRAAQAAKAKEAKKLEEQRRQREIAKNLKCPICGSHDVERISGRAILASTALKQAGKQYKCKYCKHMW